MKGKMIGHFNSKMCIVLQQIFNRTFCLINFTKVLKIRLNKAITNIKLKISNLKLWCRIFENYKASMQFVIIIYYLEILFLLFILNFFLYIRLQLKEILKEKSLLLNVYRTLF